MSRVKIGEPSGATLTCSIPVILHTMKVFQTCDGFTPPVGKPDALDLWIRTCGREIEIFAIRLIVPFTKGSKSFRPRSVHCWVFKLKVKKLRSRFVTGD